MSPTDLERPRRTWSVWLLLAVLVGWQLYVCGGDGTAGGSTLIEFGARKRNFGFPQAPWRLVASLFLHGGWLHLLANCVLIALWGVQFVRLVGGAGFLATFFLSGIWGNLASDIYGPDALAIGASGAASGIVLAVLMLALLSPEKQGWFGQARSWLHTSLAAVVLNLVMAFGLTGMAASRLDHWAHTGGALAGLVVGGLASRDEGGHRVFWGSMVALAVAAALVVWMRGPAPFD